MTFQPAHRSIADNGSALSGEVFASGCSSRQKFTSPNGCSRSPDCIPTEQARGLDGLSAEIQSLLVDMRTSKNLARQIDMLLAHGKGVLFHVCQDVYLFYPPSV